MMLVKEHEWNHSDFVIALFHLFHYSKDYRNGY